MITGGIHTAIRLILGLQVLSIIVSSVACVQMSKHVSDEALQNRFVAHQLKFEAMIDDLRREPNLEMVSPTKLRVQSGISLGAEASRSADIPNSAVVLRLRASMQLLEISQIAVGPNSVEFRVGQGSISNGDSYKGYLYSVLPPAGRLVDQLDSYRLGESDRDRFGNRVAYKSLGNSWYLYIFINA